MPTGTSFQAARSVALANSQPYQRLADVKKTDNGPVTFKLGNNPSFVGYCDPSYGGGWVLVAQYYHRSGTSPAVRSIPAHTNLPVLSPGVLGDDESAITARWGEASPAALLAFPDATANLELRFYGRTSGHTRVIHFKTDAVINRWRDNVGTMLDVNFKYALLTDHTANLPRAANSTFGVQNINNFPFYLSGTYHWGIAGGGNRWEVDDFANSNANNTIHQVWIRYKQSTPLPLVTNGDFNQGVTGWTTTGNVGIFGGAMSYSGGDTAINGIASQVCPTEKGGQYNLRFTVGRLGSCAVATARLTVEIRDSATNALLATQLATAAATYNMAFTALGPTLLRFIDATLNTVSCDVTLDNVSLSRYVQG